MRHKVFLRPEATVSRPFPHTPAHSLCTELTLFDDNSSTKLTLLTLLPHLCESP